MRFLIVLAHPEPASFNAALTRVATETLQGAGHSVEISDLYAMKFHAVVGPDDFQDRPRAAGVLDIAREQGTAFEAGSLSPDIRAEQDKLAGADVLILQFPMWWFTMPAIMKGWVDRVMAKGFAYKAGRKYDTGMFQGKSAMVSVTTGTSAATYAPNGIDGDILNVLWPIHNGILRYTGFDVITPFIAYEPGRRSREERVSMLRAYRDRLRGLDRTPRLFFHSREEYGPDERLRAGVTARTIAQRNP
ncbi:NAD(P)H-dependent oxidoreductase [Streptomyces colonosanans]|uniref:NADPH quinone oxidoreductase n=1 Tax=Streptomyces colonosanans TaxID=1428652 RepID=A0A1S2NU34_9ACTN|nr:NAD(P)H-dependent oxidoreductase [Streptomyces colonosanans]OIJ84990.1 NADPH quinone oxidoreductase [Streptomyces colonosanans]